MKIIIALWLATALAVVQAEIFCPNHCECTSTNGLTVVCTKLDPEEQVFMDQVQHLTVVNTNNKSFTLSDDIFAKMGLQRLESILIVNSSLADISVKAFHKLTSLFDVNLSDNQLFLIHPDTFVNNTNLRRLKLSGNPLQLTQLLQSPHESLLRSSSLNDLDLSRCQLTQILPKTFSQLKNLIFISLGHNLLKTIPNDVFDGLEYLEELDLSHNSISKVDKNAFKMNKEISVLKLRGNPIEVLSGINASTMEELDLSSCKLRILMKESIDGMPELMSLNLSNNNIEVISVDAFMGLQELKTLDMSNNKLIGPLPRDLFSFNRDLETLILSGNKDLGMLVDEPGFTGNHMPVSKLELADCGLTTLSSHQFNSMQNLNVLNLSGNGIQHLEDSTFTQLIQLNFLDLSNNRLTTLNDQLFAKNNALVKLVLSGNPLMHLSASTFVHLTNLKYLYANNCTLERVWDGHNKHNSQPQANSHKEKLLPGLAVFDISNNRFKTLHLDDFIGLDHLETIGLAGNPLECDKSTFEVIHFFDRYRVDPPRNELTLHPAAPSLGGVEVAGLRWTDLIDTICPVRISNNPAAKVLSVDITATAGNIESRAKAEIRTKAEIRESLPAQIAAMQNPRNSFTSLDEIVVETNDSSIMWPMLLTLSILLVALYFIIYTVTEITHRRRSIPAAYARAASLGGHVRTRGASGSPLYYKLYEECSIPAQPTKEKKNYILDFSPIHTILKKNTYKVMRNNGEANV